MKEQSRKIKTAIGLSEKSRKDVVEVLNTLLASEFTLYIKTRQFHWDVEGINFSQLHKLFESQYEFLDEKVDEIAERVRALGEFPAASLSEYSKLTEIKENLKHGVRDIEMLTQLLADHETIIKSIRQNLATVEKAGDQGSEDFLVGLMEEHEKISWMLRATLG